MSHSYQPPSSLVLAPIRETNSLERHFVRRGWKPGIHDGKAKGKGSSPATDSRRATQKIVAVRQQSRSTGKWIRRPYLHDFLKVVLDIGSEFVGDIGGQIRDANGLREDLDRLLRHEPHLYLLLLERATKLHHSRPPAELSPHAAITIATKLDSEQGRNRELTHRGEEMPPQFDRAVPSISRNQGRESSILGFMLRDGSPVELRSRKEIGVNKG